MDPYPSQDRRRDHRYHVDLPVKVEILRPELTFSPLGLPARLMDISPNGVRVSLLQLKKNEYVQLVKNVQMRYVRIHCHFPGQAEGVRLFGSITFFKYLGEDSMPACDVGVMFG